VQSALDNLLLEGLRFSKSNMLAQGWNDPCDLKDPMARFFNAIDLVHYSAPDRPAKLDDFQGNFLRKAGNYTVREIAKLEHSCSTAGSPAARTYWGPFVTERTLFFLRGFRDNVVRRASLLVHEARHASWCGHNGDTCKRGVSCDRFWVNGCAEPYLGLGANRYQVLWLWWYAVGARPAMINEEMTPFAVNAANEILELAFDNDPCFRLSEGGNKVSICD
jgi:hypothetical protein